MKHRRSILTLLLSLLSVAVSVEDALALCVHTNAGGMSEGVEPFKGILLITMVFMTGVIYYKKFIEPGTREKLLVPAVVPELHERALNTGEIFSNPFLHAETQANSLIPTMEQEWCEWEPHHTTLRQMKIGQNFASWVQLSRVNEN
ncbi:hypothetical protein [Nitrospina gracilis]|uniref:hypothetical protein n=1 Tax=Nitrospina gracilis TaxID=35801 RepID=UPI001F43389A|nr:hypothetical protein [Nitrospina gracilis]MCF8721288.1 hypothetical protein [Nitrospina gracilis Nb-211]